MQRTHWSINEANFYVCMYVYVVKYEGDERAMYGRRLDAPHNSVVVCY